MEHSGGQVDTGCCGSGEITSQVDLGKGKSNNVEDHRLMNNTKHTDEIEGPTESPILIRSSIVELQAHVDKRILVGNDFTWAEFIETLCEFDLNGDSHCVKGTGNKELNKDSQIGDYISSFKRQMKVYPIKVEMRRKSPSRSPVGPVNSVDLQNGEIIVAVTSAVVKPVVHSKRRRGRSPRKKRKLGKNVGGSIVADKKIKTSDNSEDGALEPFDLGVNGEVVVDSAQTKVEDTSVQKVEAEVHANNSAAIGGDTVESENTLSTEVPVNVNTKTNNNSPRASLVQSILSPEVHQEISCTNTANSNSLSLVELDSSLSSAEVKAYCSRTKDIEVKNVLVQDSTDINMEPECKPFSATAEELQQNSNQGSIKLQNGDSLGTGINGSSMKTQKEENSEDDSNSGSAANPQTIPCAPQTCAVMKPSVVQYLSTKVSNKDLMRVREELMKLRDNDDYFKMTALVPMAAGLLEQMLCRPISHQN